MELLLLVVPTHNATIACGNSWRGGTGPGTGLRARATGAMVTQGCHPPNQQKQGVF